MTTVGDRLLIRGDIDDVIFSASKMAEIVAWDIETTGLDWRSDQIGTVQLGIPGFGNVVVQVTEEPPPNLITLLNTSRVMKVFHHAPFDLRFMVSAWAARPTNVACTKVLSKILFPTSSDHSLKGLLANFLDVNVEKTTVRTSDWTTLALSDEQLQYAINDVAHLIRLYEVLLERAISEGVAAIAEHSFAYLPQRVQTDLRGCGDVFAH